MCSTAKDNAAQLRTFSSGKSYHQMAKSHYQYDIGYSVQICVILSTAEDVQHAAEANLSTADSHYQYN